MNIVVGVSGGIAAYKACELIAKLKRGQHKVRVVMTKNAEELVSTKIMASLSGSPVLHNLWSEADNGSFDHINIMQQWANLFVVAPATANVIGKFANGIADDYLSTAWLAASCLKVVAPAMNSVMLESPSVKRNLALLKSDGVHIIDPEVGTLACGAIGKGRLAKIDAIIKVIDALILGEKQCEF